MVLAAVVIWVLRFPVWPAAIAYLTAAVAGAVTGLVAGKPIWTTQAKLEAFLKAFVGFFVGVVAIYGARKWLTGTEFDLSGLRAGKGSFGELPALFVPLLTLGLSIFFELDNTVEQASARPRQRVEMTNDSPKSDESVFEEEAAEVKKTTRRS